MTIYQSFLITQGCICAGKSNKYGEGSRCANYEGYKDEWFNGEWCYAATETCLDARAHPSKTHSGFGVSRAACYRGIIIEIIKISFSFKEVLITAEITCIISFHILRSRSRF